MLDFTFKRYAGSVDKKKGEIILMMKTKNGLCCGFLSLLLFLMQILAAPAFAEEKEQGPVSASNVQTSGFYQTLTSIARYNSGVMNPDGGSAEIVAHDAANACFYVVNGTKGTLDRVSIGMLTGLETQVAPLEGTEIDMVSLCKADGFAYGDMTCVAISQDSLLAVAIQEEDYAKTGKVAIFSCTADDAPVLCALFDTGVQPDMLTFTPDGDSILIANEGEPRMGVEMEDPAGSVTVVMLNREDLTKSTVTTIGFDAFDRQRDSLVASGVVIQKNTMPSTDFEPEYIAVDQGGNCAYVALQEANAIAMLDMEAGQFTGVYSMGFKDFGLSANTLDLLDDEKIDIRTQSGVYGIYMPDGIAMYERDGKTYLLTANEGDSRSDWEGLDNESEGVESPTGGITADADVVWYNATLSDGLDPDAAYIFGGRSFSIYEVSGDGLIQVYDSGSDFEQITAEVLPAFFNCSNNKTAIDGRSGKKGVEPESIVTGEHNGRTYAFIGLERIGGIMVYDITEPENTFFVNYINSREFEEGIQGDVSPEGLCFITAENSPTGQPLLLAAFEVSGTVSAYELDIR